MSVPADLAVVIATEQRLLTPDLRRDRAALTAPTRAGVCCSRAPRVKAPEPAAGTSTRREPPPAVLDVTSALGVLRPPTGPQHQSCDGRSPGDLAHLRPATRAVVSARRGKKDG